MLCKNMLEIEWYVVEFNISIVAKVMSKKVTRSKMHIRKFNIGHFLEFYQDLAKINLIFGLLDVNYI